jgi:hypothetical protein
MDVSNARITQLLAFSYSHYLRMPLLRERGVFFERNNDKFSMFRKKSLSKFEEI